jgi:hypothetical protein
MADDLNLDGIMDWGSNSTAIANTNYMFSRTSFIGGEPTNVGYGQQVDANTWEFKIAEFTIDSGFYQGPGQTQFNIVKPAATNFVPPTYATAHVDGTTFNVSAVNQQGAYDNSTGITFVVPEPGTAAMVGSAALALLARRKARRSQ